MQPSSRPCRWKDVATYQAVQWIKSALSLCSLFLVADAGILEISWRPVVEHTVRPCALCCLLWGMVLRLYARDGRLLAATLVFGACVEGDI